MEMQISLTHRRTAPVSSVRTDGFERFAKTIFLVAIFVGPAALPANAYAVSDDVDAFNTCRKAEAGAKRGIPTAQFVYGLMHADGHCSTFGRKEPDTAAAWWHKAAAQGHPDAQFSLGVSYLKGIGVPKSLDTAYRLINQASQNGSAEARHLLALCRDSPNSSACR